jgi:hypothetical protein
MGIVLFLPANPVLALIGTVDLSGRFGQHNLVQGKLIMR